MEVVDGVMASRLSQLRATYHPIVWWVVGGTILTCVTGFMVMPFMALYMGMHTHAGPGLIGFVIGCSAITSMMLGLVGGSFSDRFGRKRMMAIAMTITIVDMVGYANARSIWAFLLLSILSGTAQALFFPASSALLTDVTDVEKRGSVFAIRYWAINLGAAVGPILGGYFGTVATGWTFYLAALASCIYLLAIILVFPNSAVHSNRIPRAYLREAVRVVASDKALLLFLVAGLASSLGYAQIETNLPQIMARTWNPVFAAKLFGFVLASNAIEVVVLQLPITRLVRKLGTIPTMMMGQALFAVGYVLPAFAFAPWLYFVSMFMITLGEIVVFPQSNEYVANLADEEMRGAYFGASSMTSLGAFVGPWVGGVVLSLYGGPVLFLVVAVVVLAGIPFYHWSGNVVVKRQASLGNKGNLLPPVRNLNAGVDSESTTL